MLKKRIGGRSSMVERQLPKLHTRVRFPSPAPILSRFCYVGFAPRSADSSRFYSRIERFRVRSAYKPRLVYRSRELSETRNTRISTSSALAHPVAGATLKDIVERFRHQNFSQISLDDCEKRARVANLSTMFTLFACPAAQPATYDGRSFRNP
jgi:hypothetical protein